MKTIYEIKDLAKLAREDYSQKTNQPPDIIESEWIDDQDQRGVDGMIGISVWLSEKFQEQQKSK